MEEVSHVVRPPHLGLLGNLGEELMKLKAPAWPALAIAATVFLIFWPTLTHQFVTWDDDGFLYLNPYFRGLDWAHLRWMFTTFLHGPYQPVAWLSFAVDYLIWGMSPGGFHLSGLLWHCANAALVFILCRRLLALAAPQAKPSSRASAAAFAALLFALHPLRVEPVAWATASASASEDQPPGMPTTAMRIKSPLGEQHGPGQKVVLPGRARLAAPVPVLGQALHEVVGAQGHLAGEVVVQLEARGCEQGPREPQRQPRLPTQALTCNHYFFRYFWFSWST